MILDYPPHAGIAPGAAPYWLLALPLTHGTVGLMVLMVAASRRVPLACLRPGPRPLGSDCRGLEEPGRRPALYTNIHMVQTVAPRGAPARPGPSAAGHWATTRRGGGAQWGLARRGHGAAAGSEARRCTAPRGLRLPAASAPAGTASLCPLGATRSSPCPSPSSVPTPRRVRARRAGSTFSPRRQVDLQG